MPEVRLALHAMATRFELLLHGEDPATLRAAGEEALREISYVEGLLSPYLPTSELARINRLADEKPVHVSPEVFAFLSHAKTLSTQTLGAFDITVGPLISLWRAAAETGKHPSHIEIVETQKRVGMHLLALDETNYSVRFLQADMALHPGAIGKGYAVDRAIQRLKESGIRCALLHGGSSTIYALGAPEGTLGWRIAVRHPLKAEETVLAHVLLQNAALSVSAPHGRWLEIAGQRYGHVLDPRTGRPTDRVQLAALITEWATEGDALSTALLVLGSTGFSLIQSLYPTLSALVLQKEEDKSIHLATVGPPLFLLQPSW